MEWEVEGSILRGRFTPDANDEQWCDRRLLARIHQYTIRRLRSEIEPVAARDFLRFLFEWQRVTDDSRLQGPDSLSIALALLEGLQILQKLVCRLQVLYLACMRPR